VGVAVNAIAQHVGSARACVERSRAVWTPPPKLTLSEWADEHFYLNAVSSAQAGRWTTLPYQRGFMDAITDPTVVSVTLMKSARIGYTKAVGAAIGYFIDHDPTSILAVQPTIEDAKGFSKEEIAPMIDDCPRLRGKVLDADDDGGGPRGGQNTILHKMFPGGVLSLTGANSGAGFRRITRRIIILDELDAYPPSAGVDGDPMLLAIRRSETFWNRKIVAGSTPLVEGHSRIEDRFREGTQERYYVPCPQCDHFDVLVWPSDKGGGNGHWMHWTPGEPQTAHFVCGKNGCVIEHDRKFEMVRRGEWRQSPRGEDDPPIDPSHRSFHIWTAYSFSPNATWSQIAAEYERAKGEPDKLKTFVNTVRGETYRESGEAPEWALLFNRREQYPIGSIPAGVRWLTCGVDVQKDSFRYEVVGWAADKTSWSIEAGVIPGDTSKEESYVELDRQLLSRVFPREGAPEDSPGLTIRMLAIDSGYNTHRVLNWVRTRDPMRVIAVKGLPTDTSISLVSVPRPADVIHNGRIYRGGAKVWPVTGGIAKGELYGLLRLEPEIRDDGTLGPLPPGYCHFPEHQPEYFKQLTSERLVTITHKRKGTKTREWQVITGRENHWLDCRVYARACASILGLDRMKPKTEDAPPTGPVLAPAPAPPPRPAAKKSDYGSPKVQGFLARGRSFWKR
jgi:phage terminase large subunit GpA-like protein